MARFFQVREGKLKAKAECKTRACLYSLEKREPLESPPPSPPPLSGSGKKPGPEVQTDVTTPITVVRGGSGVQTNATTPTMLGPVVHRGKDTTHKTL